MRKLSFSALQWIMGAFCFVIGAMMLVIPHQFNTPSYAALRPQLPVWGILFLLAGEFLLIIAAFRLRRMLVIAGHLLISALLLVLALGFAAVQGWSGLIVYAILSVGTLFAPFLSGSTRQSSTSRPGDFFTLVMAAAGTLTGAAMVIAPNLFWTNLFERMWDVLPWYGIGWLVGGLILIGALFDTRTPRQVYYVAHVFLGGLFVLWAINVAVPLRAWTGVSLYGGLGFLLATLPWLQWHLRRIDPSSLQTRFTVTLIVVAATPLLLQAAIVTDQEAQIAIAQSLALQQRIAGELARHIDDYVWLHRSALETLTAEPGLLTLPTSEQLTWLRRFQKSYPDVYLLALYDAAGIAIVRSDGGAAPPVADLALFQEARATNGPSVQIFMGRTTHLPLFVFGVPIRDPQGRFAGLAALSIETTQVSDILQRSSIGQGDLIYLVDTRGHVISYPDAAIANSFADLSQRPPVAALLNADVDLGSIRYGAPGNEHLAGFSRVQGLGWGVVAERTEAIALAGTYAGRELAFAIFLLLTGVASVIGIINAALLTTPLRAIVHAINQFGAGNVNVPLPHSSVTDLQALSGAFGALRETLTARTAQRDRAEEALRHSESRLRRLVDSNIIGVIFSQRDGGIGDANTAFLSIVGYTQEDLHSGIVRWNAMTPPEYFHLDEHALDEAQQRGACTPYEKEYIRKDGTRVPVLVGFARLEGSETDYVAFIVDLTIRKRAETQLREQTEVVETINHIGALLTAELDFSKLIQAVTDAATELTDAQYGVFFANVSPDAIPAWKPIAMTGISQEHIFDVSATPHLTTLLSPVLHGDSIVRRGNVRQDPLYGITPPDFGMPASHVSVTSCLAVPVISRSGAILGTLFFGHPDPDVFTERHEQIAVGLAAQTAIAMDNARLYTQIQSHARTLEQEVARRTGELRAALARAQSADRAKSTMLSTVTHEMRTPLSSIIGFSGLILNRDPAPDKRREFAAAIHSEARRLARLINDFLDLQRLESGRQVFHFEVLELADLIQDIINKHEFDEDARHTIRLDLNPVLPAYADRERIRQVILNLLSNAIKYSPGGGEITLWLRQGAAQETVFSIRDTGLGIAPDELEHLFERFHRGEVAEELRIRGTGLGLALCKEIILSHYGRIWGESSGVNQGATFSFALPDATTAQQLIEEIGLAAPKKDSDVIITGQSG